MNYQEKKVYYEYNSLSNVPGLKWQFVSVIEPVGRLFESGWSSEIYKHEGKWTFKLTDFSENPNITVLT